MFTTLYNEINDWIENIKQTHNIFTYEDYKVEYTNLLVGLIGYSSLRQTDTLKKIILDPQEFIQATKGKVTASDTFTENNGEWNGNFSPNYDMFEAIKLGVEELTRSCARIPQVMLLFNCNITVITIIRVAADFGYLPIT